MFRKFAIGTITCVLVAGCQYTTNQVPDLGGPSSITNWVRGDDSEGGTVIRTGNLFMLWSNSAGGGSGSSSNNKDGVKSRGWLVVSIGHSIEYQCQSDDGKTGRLVIDGNNYDLTKGRLFLVTNGSDGPRIQQMQRDIALMKSDRESLVQLSKSDAEIQNFFAGVSDD